MKISLIFLALFIGNYYGLSQIGGTSTFQLLNLPFSARANALGTDFISVKDADVNLGIGNPSLLNSRMKKTLGINTGFFGEGIKYGMACYAFGLKKGILSTNIRFIDYGEFTRTEENGVQSGTFKPTEQIIGVGYGVPLNPRISIGGNLNFLQSNLETYSASAFAIDLAGTYEDTTNNITVTALVKNAGFQFANYTTKNNEKLPVEFQIASSYKLKHAPFRFSLLAHHLNKWNISYNDPTLKPTVDPLSGDTIAVKYDKFGKILFNHLTIQTEILIGKHIHLRAAFDYHKRQELKIVNRPGLSGFSFGTGIYFNKFSIDYGFNVFSKAGALQTITFTTNLGKWKNI